MKRILLSILLSVPGIILYSQSLTLDLCKNMTIAHNNQIKEATLKVEESEQLKKNAFTNYFPHISAGFLAMKADDYLIKEEIPEANLPVYNGNPATLPSATQFAYFPGMSLELLDYTNMGYIIAMEPLYMGGRVRNGNKLAKLGTTVNSHQLILSTEEALIKTEEYFWTLISLKERMKTIEAYSKLLDNLYQDVSVSYNAGLIDRSNLLKVEIKQNELKANSLKLRNGIEMLSRTLCQHIGLEYSKEIRFEAKLGKSEFSNSIVNPESAVIKRQEYKMLENSIEAEILQKRLARGEVMPQLSVGVTGLYLDMMENQSTHGLATASLIVPLSGWWGGAHKIKEHNIRVEMAEIRLNENKELMMLQIEKAYKDMAEAYEQIKIAEKTEEEAIEHLRVCQDNYDAGIINTSDMLEAQAIFQEAEDAYTDALCGLEILKVKYMQAIGEYY